MNASLVQVNPAVLGGVVVDFGDKTIDLSVVSRVNKLNNLLSRMSFVPLGRTCDLTCPSQNPYECSVGIGSGIAAVGHSTCRVTLQSANA